MKISNIFLLGISIAFVLGQFARIDFGNGIVLSILDIFVAITVFVWVALCIIKKQKPISESNKIIFSSASFVIICIISLLIHISNYTFFHLIIGFLYIFRWVMYMSLFIIVSQAERSVKEIIKKYLLITGTVIVLIGYIQYFFYSNLRNLFYLGWDNHLYRMFSTFLDPNFAGVFFVLFIIFLADFFFDSLKKKDKKKTIFYLSLITITLIAIVLTYSRSAIIALIIASCVFLFFTRRKKLISVVFIILFIAIISLSNFTIEGENLFRSASSKARIQSIQEAVYIFTKNPVFGVGFNTYRYVQIKYGFRKGDNALISHADAGTDNSFLFILVTTGIIGFLVYIRLYYLLLKEQFSYFKSDSNSFAIATIASLIALFVSAFFINSLFYPMIMLWIWTLVGLTDYK